MKNFIFALVAFISLTAFSSTKAAITDPEPKDIVAKIVLNTNCNDVDQSATISFTTMKEFKSFDENELSEWFDSKCVVSAIVTVFQFKKGAIGKSLTTTTTTSKSASVTGSSAEIGKKVHQVKGRLIDSLKP